MTKVHQGPDQILTTKGKKVHLRGKGNCCRFVWAIQHKSIWWIQYFMAIIVGFLGCVAKNQKRREGEKNRIVTQFNTRSFKSIWLVTREEKEKDT